MTHARTLTVDPTQARAPDGARACFVGATLLVTSWGRCRFAELARLTSRYTATEADWGVKIASLQIAHANVTAALNDAQDAWVDAEEGAFKQDLLTLITSYTDQQTSLSQQLQAAQAACTAHLTGMLPQVLLYATDGSVSTQLARVVQANDASALAQVAVDDASHVLCTLDQVFVSAANLDVDASQLAGSEIKRIDGSGSPTDALLINDVPIEVLGEPVAVFDVAVEGDDAFAVAAQGGGVALLAKSEVA